MSTRSSPLETSEPDLVDLPAAHSERGVARWRGPAGNFSVRAAGSAANAVLADKVSGRKPGPAEKYPAGRQPERHDPGASGAPPRLEPDSPRSERRAAPLRCDGSSRRRS